MKGITLKKIMAAVTGLVMALLIGVAGAAPVSAQPAPTEQAETMDYGTYVWYYTCSSLSGSCTNWHLRIWTMNGAHNYLFQGGHARNVRTVCPADSQHRISYWRPNGTYVPVKGYGECQDMRFAVEGEYRFAQQD